MRSWSTATIALPAASATVTVDTARITALRASGRTWTSIAQELGVGEGTVRRAAAAKNLLQIAPASALVPVLEPGHFDPPQTFVSGGGHFSNHPKRPTPWEE